MKQAFTRYEKFVVAALAFLQFTIILDFMILSPLGAVLIPSLRITTGQFGLVVSAYAFSAGASSLLAAGFADRFDRKKLLLFFYGGFLAGTLFCGLAQSYATLLLARMLTGVFAGVIGSIVFAIVTDLFPLEVRGRVMGTIQTAFAASQVMGIPLGLYFSNLWGWHAPFIMIVAVGAAAGLVIAWKLRPVDAHLALKGTRSPVRHLVATVSNPRYVEAFAAMGLLSTGGFMIMPFSSAFSVNNVGIPLDKLPLLYMVTGCVALVAGPLLGRAADRYGKLKVFCGGSLLSGSLIIAYTHLGITPLPVVMVLNSLLFASITARMISASALVSAVPEPADRGSFMSVTSSLQQVSGGLASALAGMIVLQTASGRIERFDILGYVVAGSMAVMVMMMISLNRKIMARLSASGK